MPVDVNFQIVAPLITLGAAGLIVLVLDLLLPFRYARRPWFIVTTAGLLLAGGYVWSLWGVVDPAGAAPTWSVTAGAVTTGISSFLGAFTADRFSLLFSGVILAAALAATGLSMRRYEEDTAGYLALLLFASLGMMALVGGTNLMTIFMGLELLSLSLYVAVGFRQADARAKEGALKYLILGAVASGFLLYGFALLYGATGTVWLAGIQSYWAAQGADGMTGLYRAGMALTLAGFAFKLALVPFHAWAPDAYEGAPAPVTAFMAVGTKVAAFAALVRLLAVGVPVASLTAILLPIAVLAVASMAVGSVLAVKQENLKRLLAYSSISHAGYFMLALPGLSSSSVTAGAFYSLAYLLMTVGAFTVIVWLGDSSRSGAGIEAYRGLLYRRPGLAAFLTLFLLSLVGIPGTAGFIGKFLLVSNGVAHSAWLMVAGFVLTTGISAYAYLRIVLLMCKRPSEQAQAPTVAYGEIAAASEPELASDGESDLRPDEHELTFAWPLGIVLTVSAAGTLYLGLMPQAALELMQNLLPLL